MNTQTGCVPSPEDPRKLRDVTSSVHARLRLITWAGRDPGLTPPNKAVILAVVAHADEHNVCKASDQHLAMASHTSVPTVQRSLRLFEASRVIERANDAWEGREIRLIPCEHPLVVVDVDSFSDRKKKQQQEQHATSPDCSPAIMPTKTETPGPGGGPDHDAGQLVALLTAWKVTPKRARELVRDFPERIVPQVEAHRYRNVLNPAGSLITAIREDWPTDPPIAQRQPTTEEIQERAREEREAQRHAALDAQARLNARKRDDADRVEAFWEGLSQAERAAFEQEAIEASPDRGNILNHGPDSPLYTLLRVAARREHIRRKLGLPLVDES
jgi:hypothetical protein